MGFDLTFQIEYPDGRVVRVKEPPVAHEEDLVNLCIDLLQCFKDAVCRPGDLLRQKNVKVWDLISKTCNLLPVVGGGTVEVEQIKLLEKSRIIEIFFTKTLHRDPETGVIMPPFDYGEIDPETGAKAKLEQCEYQENEIANLLGYSFFLNTNDGLMQIADRRWYEAYTKKREEVEKEKRKLENQKPTTLEPSSSAA